MIRPGRRRLLAIAGLLAGAGLLVWGFTEPAETASDPFKFDGPVTVVGYTIRARIEMLAGALLMVAGVVGYQRTRGVDANNSHR
jgi:hypothetical protein